MWNGVASKKLVVQQQVHMWQACRVTCMKADLTLLPPQPLTPTSNMLTWWTSKNVKTLAWFSLCWHIHVHRIQTFQYSYIPYLFICIYKGIYIYACIYAGTCRNLSSWKHRFFNEAGFWRTCWKGQKRKPNNWWNSRFATVPASLHRPHELHNKKPFLRVYRGYVSRSMVFLCYWNRGFEKNQPSWNLFQQTSGVVSRRT